MYDQQDKSFDEEIQRYRQLGSHPNIAELIDADRSSVQTGDVIIPVYHIVSEWVEGVTLTDFISSATFSAEMYGVILDIGSGVARFENRNLWHTHEQ